jgi:hypothetical protein
VKDTIVWEKLTNGGWSLHDSKSASFVYAVMYKQWDGKWWYSVNLDWNKENISWFVDSIGNGRKIKREIAQMVTDYHPDFQS